MTVNMKNWQELKKPNVLDIKPGGDPKRKATFVAEPLERGFGLTMGNALRRVLLSSLQGAAVTSIKIENALHEFSSLPGVREDVTDIVLNVKQIALKMESDEAKRLQLSATGPAEVKAGDIAVTGDLEIMNPDLVICHLDEGASLNMELTVNVGKGYVPAVANRPADAPIGLIPVDSLYSPIRQVSYKIDNARVGQELDFDKLNLTIETDGTVTPEDAIAYAARILQDQLQLFVHFEEALEQVSSPVGLAAQQSQAESDANQLNRYLLKKVDELELCSFGKLPQERQYHLYWRSGAEDRSRNAAHPELWPQVLERNQGSAVSMGLRLGMDIPGWPPENIEEMAKKLEQELLG